MLPTRDMQNTEVSNGFYSYQGSRSLCPVKRGEKNQQVYFSITLFAQSSLTDSQFFHTFKMFDDSIHSEW